MGISAQQDTLCESARVTFKNNYLLKLLKHYYCPLYKDKLQRQAY